MASCAAEAPRHRRWSTSQQETTPPSRHPLHNRPIRSFVVRRVKCRTCPPVSPRQLGSSLQSCLWTSSPGHLLPGGVVLLEGAGLEQERRRVLVGLLVSCGPAMQESEH